MTGENLCLYWLSINWEKSQLSMNVVENRIVDDDSVKIKQKTQTS